MKKGHLLFICTENLQRSPTAASLFKNNKKYLAKSAGTGIFSPVKVSKQAIKWADIIFCMENYHKKYIKENFPDESKHKKIYVLNIPNTYFRNDPRLIGIFEEKLSKWLN